MQKIQLLFLLMAAFVAKADCQKVPTMYPGAVPLTAEDENRNRTREGYATFSYLTRDNYSNVRSYYVNENAEPRYEQDEGDGSKSAFFSYLRRMPEDVGVTVSKRQGRSRVPSRIFSKLEGLVFHGIITKDRLSELERKYSYLEGFYFVNKKDESGKVMSVDEAIYNKYEKKIASGGSEDIDQEAMMEKAAQLINSGRIQEGAELMKRAVNQQLVGAELALSPEVVDIWIECLDEIASNAYTILIHIQL